MLSELSQNISELVSTGKASLPSWEWVINFIFQFIYLFVLLSNVIKYVSIAHAVWYHYWSTIEWLDVLFWRFRTKHSFIVAMNTRGWQISRCACKVSFLQRRYVLCIFACFYYCLKANCKKSTRFINYIPFAIHIRNWFIINRVFIILQKQTAKNQQDLLTTYHLPFI